MSVKRKKQRFSAFNKKKIAYLKKMKPPKRQSVSAFSKKQIASLKKKKLPRKLSVFVLLKRKDVKKKSKLKLLLKQRGFVLKKRH